MCFCWPIPNGSENGRGRLRPLPFLGQRLFRRRLLQAQNDLMRAVPPSCGMVVVVFSGRPVGPVSCIERNQLLGICERDNHRFVVDVFVCLYRQIDDLWIAKWEGSNLIDDLAESLRAISVPAPVVGGGLLTDGLVETDVETVQRIPRLIYGTAYVPVPLRFKVA